MAFSKPLKNDANVSPLFPRLPAELWRHVIDDFNIDIKSPQVEGGYACLSNFAVAGGSWQLLDLCRQHLFSSVDVTLPSQADRLLAVLEANDGLSRYIKHLFISSGDDPEGNGEDEEWDTDGNPFEDPSILQLLPELKAVKRLTLLGSVHYDPHVLGYWDSPDEWAEFFKTCPLTSVSVQYSTFPLALLSHCAKLTALQFEDVAFVGELDLDNPVQTFNHLHSLNMYQTRERDLTTLTRCIRGGQGHQRLGPTLKRFTFHVDPPVTWISTFSAVMSLGSATLTNITLSFSFGFYNGPFGQSWRGEPAELTECFSQLRCLESIALEYKFLYNSKDFVDDNSRSNELLERQGQHLFEPYLSSIVDGLIKGRPRAVVPFRRMDIMWSVDELHGSTIELVDLQRLAPALISATSWGKLDSWMIDGLAPDDQHIPNVYIGFDTSGLLETYDKESSGDIRLFWFWQPITAQMPRLRRVNALGFVEGFDNPCGSKIDLSMY